MEKMKAGKNELIVIGIFFTVLLCALFFVLSRESEPSRVSSSLDTPLTTAFKESNAELLTVTAQSWCLIDHVYHDGPELSSFFDSIREVLGDDDLLSFDEYDDEGYANISLSGVTEQGYQMDLVLQSMETKGEENETYLIVNLTDQGKVQNIQRMETYLGKIFASVSCKSEPSVMVEGCYDEIKSKREKKKIAKAVFGAVNGDIEEKVSDKDYVSFSGYTQAIEYSVKSDRHELNFQAALSDNEEEGKTHIYIGTPVVFSDF